jgi:hypothetical protein
MQKKPLLSCLGCLVLGGVLGHMLPVGNRPPSEGPTIESQRERTGASMNSRSKAATRSRLSGAAEAEEHPFDSGLSEPERDGSMVMVPARLIEELSRASAARSLGQDLFSGDGKLEKYLQITDQEKTAVQKAWESARQRVRDLEVASSVPEYPQDGSVRITVPDLSGQLGVLGEEFESSVKHVLGGNRGDAFLAMKQADKIISSSAGERVYTVDVEAVGDGAWRYHMTFENDEGRRVWVGASVPNEIRHLTDAAKVYPSVVAAPNEQEPDE